MGIITEFKEFVMKGNVLDLAVGIIIGSAFASIVNSLVEDVLMPLIGILMNGHDFSTLCIQVGDAKIMYGKAITASVNFLIIALVLFFVLRAANKGRLSSGKAA